MVSLICSNTNSCDSIEYNILKDKNNYLSGYAYSQDAGWINFNPNYGGASVDVNGEFSG